MDATPAGVFEEVVLTHRAHSGAPTGADAWGNPTYAITTTLYRARLKVTGNNALILRFGADGKETVFEGSFMSPAIVPPPIQVGAEFGMSWRGVSGVATLRQVSPRALLNVDEALGQRIVLAWRPA